MTRFVVCGETLIDLVQSSTDVPTSFRSTWLALSAGGPMNSAVALGKLGAKPQFLGRLSRDAFGRQLREHILAADVGLDLATESSQATSIAVVSLDEEGVASYTFHFSDTANFGWQVDDLPRLDEADWLHIASLSCVVSPGAEVLLDWMSTVRSGVSYDINVRPTVITDPVEYWAKVQPWLRAVGRRAGIVKASDEDIRFLARAAGGSDPVEVASGWVEQYPRARGRGGRRARRGTHPRRRLPHAGGRHRRRRGHVHGRLPGGPRRAGPAPRPEPAPRSRGRLDRVLAAGSPAADHGRGGRAAGRRVGAPGPEPSALPVEVGRRVSALDRCTNLAGRVG
jgi:fructokinase